MHHVCLNWIRGGNLVWNYITLEPIIGSSGCHHEIKDQLMLEIFLQVCYKSIHKWSIFMYMAKKIKIVNFENYRGQNYVYPILGWNWDIMAIQVVCIFYSIRIQNVVSSVLWWNRKMRRLVRSAKKCMCMPNT